MTYWTRSIIVAAVTLLVAAGCEDNSNSDEADAGQGDAAQTQQAPEPDTGSDDTQMAQSPDASDDRPSATADESGTISEEPPLEIREFLPVKQIQQLDESREYTRSPLPGIEPSPTYNAFRIHPVQGDDYGAGLQVWMFDDQKKGPERFETLRSQYLNVDKRPAVLEGIEAKGFASTRGDIQNVVVFAEGKLALYALSCSKKLCDSPDKLRELVTFVHEQVSG